MKCRLLDYAFKKEYGESSTSYIKRVREYFEKEIKNKEYSFRGKRARLLFWNDPDSDKCWNKFFIGSERLHNNTTKIDQKRLPYVMFIDLILTGKLGCKSCTSYEELKEKKCKIIVKCDKVEYVIILSFDIFLGEYLILSAYKK